MPLMMYWPKQLHAGFNTDDANINALIREARDLTEKDWCVRTYEIPRGFFRKPITRYELLCGIGKTIMGYEYQIFSFHSDEYETGSELITSVVLIAFLRGLVEGCGNERYRIMRLAAGVQAK